jgi:4-hydroxybenzoate polyprenyltransferase
VRLRLLLIHLRFHFQLLLAPVWLWGWLVAGGGLHPAVVLGFVAFHLFLYTGVTAFNSYYDRDVGPVGGLERPPPVPELLLPVSLLLQAVGLAMCTLINTTLTVLYAAFVALSVAYSHPRIRLKAHPFASLVLVAFGQGVLVFASVWAAVRGSLIGLDSRDGVLGCLSAALLILAQYPLTQLYQVEEDAARGDQTLAVAWGQRAACWFAIGCACTGGVCMILLVLI